MRGNETKRKQRLIKNKRGENRMHLDRLVPEKHCDLFETALSRFVSQYEVNGTGRQIINTHYKV